MVLEKNEIHIWLADFSRFENIDSYRAFLSYDEFDQLRHLHESFRKALPFLSRALLRNTLSRYHDRSPRQWEFRLGTYGKPEIANFEMPFFFNVSHSAQLAVCAVTQIGRVGVDLERTDRVCAAERIAQRFFDLPEVAMLLQLTGESRQKRFFELWTLKEAYLKAKGVGLRQPLNSMRFFLQSDGSIAIQFNEGFEDSSCWMFSLLEPQLHYQLALAVDRCHSSERLSIRCFFWMLNE